MITKAARKRRMALEDRDTLILVNLLRILSCSRLYALLILTLAAVDHAKISSSLAGEPSRCPGCLWGGGSILKGWTHFAKFGSELRDLLTRFRDGAGAVNSLRRMA